MVIFISAIVADNRGRCGGLRMRIVRIRRLVWIGIRGISRVSVLRLLVWLVEHIRGTDRTNVAAMLEILVISVIARVSVIPRVFAFLKRDAVLAGEWLSRV